MPTVDREINRFSDFLTRQGQKLTRERTALVREIFSTHYHFEADELLFTMKQKSVKISRATVYRTLELLVKSGLVRRVHLGEDHYHYEHVRGDSHHDHLICIECKRIVEFEEPRVEALQDEIADKYGFVIRSHKHELYGVCPDCQRKAKRGGN